MDAEALDALTAAGVFSTRMCKLCDDGVVVMGEYGLSKVIFDAGWNIATLMSMCALAPCNIITLLIMISPLDANKHADNLVACLLSSMLAAHIGTDSTIE